MMILFYGITPPCSFVQYMNCDRSSTSESADLTSKLVLRIHPETSRNTPGKPENLESTTISEDHTVPKDPAVKNEGIIMGAPRDEPITTEARQSTISGNFNSGSEKTLRQKCGYLQRGGLFIDFFPDMKTVVPASQQNRETAESAEFVASNVNSEVDMPEVKLSIDGFIARQDRSPVYYGVTSLPNFEHSIIIQDEIINSSCLEEELVQKSIGSHSAPSAAIAGAWWTNTAPRHGRRDIPPLWQGAAGALSKVDTVMAGMPYERDYIHDVEWQWDVADEMSGCVRSSTTQKAGIPALRSSDYNGKDSSMLSNCGKRARRLAYCIRHTFEATASMKLAYEDLGTLSELEDHPILKLGRVVGPVVRTQQGIRMENLCAHIVRRARIRLL
ncbi:hypothetical protein FB451DRAFT_1174934 [Mycena latifolia]|nr:hypothetical protein FB451DRAFT_1174934 [Mycena latifolia]